MADRWTYPVADVRTGVEVHPNLPLLVDSFDDGLGVGEGALTAKLPLRAGTKYDVDDVTDPMRRAVIPCRNGQPRGAYMWVGEKGYTPKSGQLDLAAVRIDDLFNRRDIWSTLVFRQVDQLVIARNLMLYALGRTPMNVEAGGMGELVTLLPPEFQVPWLRLDNSYSGRLRDRLDTTDGYQAAGHKNIGAELTKLSQLEDGFEYRLRYDRDPVAFTYSATVELAYPDFAEFPGGVTLEHPGRNVLDYNYARDGDEVVTAARGYGSGTGSEKLTTAPLFSARAVAAGYPGLAVSVTTTATEPASITASAAARLAAYDTPASGVTLKLNPRLIGRIPLGAVLPVHLVDDRRWRNGRRFLVKVVGHKIEPSRPGRPESFTPSLLRVDGA